MTMTMQTPSLLVYFYSMPDGREVQQQWVVSVFRTTAGALWHLELSPEREKARLLQYDEVLELARLCWNAPMGAEERDGNIPLRIGTAIREAQYAATPSKRR
jgi:hypothetical protein